MTLFTPFKRIQGRPTSAWLCAVWLGVSFAPQGHATSVSANEGTPRFTVSEDGHEVRDAKSRLIWRRCVQGMAWNGTTCAGVPDELDYNQAQALALAEFKATAKRWRLPHVAELKLLLDKSLAQSKGALLDPQMFPSTPATWHWSASVSIGSNSFNQYTYDNIQHGRSPGTVNQGALLFGWAVNFGNADAAGNVPRRNPLVVRLVRPDF